MGDNRITTVSVVSIPTDTFLSRDEIARLQHQVTIEHAPPQEAPAIVESPKDREFTPQTDCEQQLLAELESLSPQELLERAKQAGFVDVDGS